MAAVGIPQHSKRLTAPLPLLLPPPAPPNMSVLVQRFKTFIVYFNVGIEYRWNPFMSKSPMVVQRTQKRTTIVSPNPPAASEPPEAAYPPAKEGEQKAHRRGRPCPRPAHPRRAVPVHSHTRTHSTHSERAVATTRLAATARVFERPPAWLRAERTWSALAPDPRLPAAPPTLPVDSCALVLCCLSGSACSLPHSPLRHASPLPEVAIEGTRGGASRSITREPASSTHTTPSAVGPSAALSR